MSEVFSYSAGDNFRDWPNFHIPCQWDDIVVRLFTLSVLWLRMVDLSICMYACTYMCICMSVQL